MATLLTLDNSFSQIQGLSAEQMKALRKVLSYSSNPQAYYYSRFGPKTTYLIDRKGYFPSGLVRMVRAWLLTNHINYKVTDNRKKPQPKIGMFKLCL